MRDKTPKKRQSKKKSEEFDPKADADVKDITQKALNSILQEQLRNKVERKKHLDALACTIEEFLSSYILLGYSVDGEPINIISAHNQQEADSLTTLMNKFINNFTHNGDRSEREED